MRILLIEDNQSVADAVTAVLQDEGYDVTHTPNGREGLKHLTGNPVDLVISDILMPEMDGFEVFDHLKRMPNRPKVIFISGGGNRVPVEMIIPLAEKISDGVLMKPFSNRDLLATMARVMAA